MTIKRVPWHSEPVMVPGLESKLWHLETAFQIYCATWLRKSYSLTGDNKFNRWHHSANERQGARAGLIAKLMGQAKGMPDFIHYGSRTVIELKVGGNQLSPEQEGWLDYFREIGWETFVVRSFEEFVEAVA